MDKYEVIKDLGAGSFGVTKLLRHKETHELVAMKFLERGPKIDKNVGREIINHQVLRHPTVIGFKEVILSPTHLVIVMEYAAGGELFERICNSGRFSEDEARYFFQQVIIGVNYCHSKGICHRDLKLDNILLDGSAAPRLKICDFGFSKSSLLHSKPKTNVGSATYAAPEVLSHGQYDGKMADVWSCGVILYVMLVGAYPFEDKDDSKNFQKTIQRIMKADYKIPDYVHISQECRHLLSRIFVSNPTMRISLKEIKSHPWFLKNLARELTESAQAIYYQKDNDSSSSLQSGEDIMKMVKEARYLPSTFFEWIIEEDDESEEEEEDLEEEDEDDEEEEEHLEEEDEDDEKEEDDLEEEDEYDEEEKEDVEEEDAYRQLVKLLMNSKRRGM